MKILSADDIIQKEEVQKRNIAVEDTEESNKVIVSEKVKLEDLQNFWMIFAEKRREEGKNTEYVLLNQKLELIQGHIIKIKLTNAIQLPSLDGIKTELLQFLREKLNNSHLTIEAELIELESGDMIYTAKEKMNFLMEKHPNLKDLQHRLGLDTDY